MRRGHFYSSPSNAFIPRLGPIPLGIRDRGGRAVDTKNSSRNEAPSTGCDRWMRDKGARLGTEGRRMSARSWCEARTQGVFVSVRDTDATEDDVLVPRDRAQPVFLCFQPSSDSSVAFVAGGYGRDRGQRSAPPSAARRRSASFETSSLARSRAPTTGPGASRGLSAFYP